MNEKVSVCILKDIFYFFQHPCLFFFLFAGCHSFHRAFVVMIDCVRVRAS